MGRPAHGRPRPDRRSLVPVQTYEPGSDGMIRVTIGSMPALLRSIVRSALETQGDFAVMETPSEPRSEDLDATDVLLLCADRADREVLSIPVLIGTDTPAVVAVSSEGNSAFTIRTTTEDSRIGAASDLCDVVRRAASDRRRVAN